MHQIIRLIAFLVVLTLFIFPPGRSAHAQERTIKSKYEFSTPELDAAQKLYSGKKYAEALSAFEAIIEKAKANQNYEEQIFAMEKRALALRRLEQYDRAIETMDEAIQLSLNKLPKGHFLVSKMYYTRGTTDHTLRDYYNARAYLDTALVYYNNSSQYDSSSYYRYIEYKYYAYEYSEGSQDTLIKYLDKLIELENIRQKKLPRPDRILNLLQGYPKIFNQKGDFEQALAHAIRNYKFANENRKAVSNRYFAEAQYDLAGVLYFKKEYLKALEIGLEAMPIVESTERSDMPEYYAFNNLLGVIYSTIGDYEKALPYFRKAAEVPFEEGNLYQRRSRLSFYAQVIMNMGICYGNLEETNRAEEYLKQSLKIRKSITTAPSSDFHNNYEYLGNFFFQQSHWEKALVLYDSALRNGLLSYKSSISSFPDADITFSFKDLSTLTKKTASLNRYAQSESSEDLLLSAKNYAVKTSDILMNSRNDFVASEGKLFLSKNFKNLYETGIDACYELYLKTGDSSFFEEGLSFSRKSKAILFLEQSHEFGLVNNNVVPQEKKEEFFESKRRIESLQQSFYELIDNSITGDSVLKINEELLEARLDNQNIKDKIETLLLDYDLEPVFDGVLENPSTIRVNDGEALIEFFYGEENIYVFGKSSNSISFRKIELNDRIEKPLQRVVKTISTPPDLNNIKNEFLSFRDNSSLIYKTLVKPVLEDLKGGLKHLIIVPDEFLSRLPFEVLVKGDNSASNDFSELNYLTKSLSIQYELSSALFNNDLKEVRAKKGLLAFGFRESQISENRRSGFGTLPGTEREIQFLKSAIEGTYLIGENGTKSDFLLNARDYDVLHLAVHGKADSTNRYESSLIFNGQGNNVLNMNDLYLAGLRARLAVLSACESGIGAVNKGEGTFSIARGFALIGVPSLVMSLWKVNDNTTSKIMVDMYEGFISEGYSINEALRSSKLSYLSMSDEYSAHPYYWGAFLQLGQNTVLEEEKNTNQSVWIFSTIVFFSLLLFFLYKKKKG